MRYRRKETLCSTIREPYRPELSLWSRGVQMQSALAGRALQSFLQINDVYARDIVPNFDNHRESQTPILKLGLGLWRPTHQHFRGHQVDMLSLHVDSPCSRRPQGPFHARL